MDKRTANTLERLLARAGVERAALVFRIERKPLVLLVNLEEDEVSATWRYYPESGVKTFPPGLYAIYRHPRWGWGMVGSRWAGDPSEGFEPEEVEVLRRNRSVRMVPTG